MSKERIRVEIVRYRDKEGQPTCALNFQSWDVCKFLGTRKFGQEGVCMLCPDAVLLRRLGTGCDTLIPLAFTESKAERVRACVAWRDERWRIDMEKGGRG